MPNLTPNPKNLSHLIFSFFGSPVRCYKVNKKPMMAVADIAQALQVPPNTLIQIIKRNRKIFDDTCNDIMSFQVGAINSKKGSSKTYTQQRKIILVDHDGLMGLLMLLSYKRIKDPAIQVSPWNN